MISYSVLKLIQIVINIDLKAISNSLNFTLKPRILLPIFQSKRMKHRFPGQFKEEPNGIWRK